MLHHDRNNQETFSTRRTAHLDGLAHRNLRVLRELALLLMLPALTDEPIDPTSESTRPGSNTKTGSRSEARAVSVASNTLPSIPSVLSTLREPLDALGTQQEQGGQDESRSKRKISPNSGCMFNHVFVSKHAVAGVAKRGNTRLKGGRPVQPTQPPKRKRDLTSKACWHEKDICCGIPGATNVSHKMIPMNRRLVASQLESQTQKFRYGRQLSSSNFPVQGSG